MAGGGAYEGTAYVAERPKAFCKYAKKTLRLYQNGPNPCMGQQASLLLGGGGDEMPAIRSSARSEKGKKEGKKNGRKERWKEGIGDKTD